MTRDERVARTVNRLAVIERLLSLEGMESADLVPSVDELSVQAGIHELIYEAYETLEPVTQAPAEISSWEPEQAEQPEPDETGGERTAQPGGAR